MCLRISIFVFISKIVLFVSKSSFYCDVETSKLRRVANDRKLASIKLAHSENSRILFLSRRKKKKGKNRKKRRRRAGKRRKGKVRDLVREKVSTFAMTLSVVDKASAARECLHRFLFFFFAAKYFSCRALYQITENTVSIKFLINA